MQRISPFRQIRGFWCPLARLRAATLPRSSATPSPLDMLRSGVLLLSLAGVWPSEGTASPAHMCDAAAWLAAAQLDIPASVLRSVTRTETGRPHGGKLEPWPWTVNLEGKGHWFETEGSAKAFVEAALRRGVRSFDVGCFQINYKWHGSAFQSIDQMFDPKANALYAARFLATLHAETGDWSRAAGAYHSRTPHHSETYRARFDRIRQGLTDQPGTVTQLASIAAPAAPLRRAAPNNFPLLQQSDSGRSPGSLVPLGAASRGALIALGSTEAGS